MCAFLIFVSAAAACSDTTPHVHEPASILGQNLRQVGTQILHESNTAFLGRPVGLFVDSNSIISIDGFSTRILAFDRLGELKWVSGRVGSGPGEFQAPSYFAAPNDSQLVIVDMALRRVTTLRRSDGAYVSQSNIDGTPTYAFAHHDTLLLGLVDYAKKHSLALYSKSQPTVSFGPFPDAYSKVPAMALISTNSVATMWGDTTALLLAGVEQLYLLKVGGPVLDSLALPRIIRRGVPVTLPKMSRDMDAVRNIFEKTSLPWAISRLPDGLVAVIHQDITFSGKRLTNELYLSLVAPSRGEACVDASLAVSREMQAQVFFVADTVFVLDQTVPDSGAAQTRVRSLVVDESKCRWLPTKPRS